MRLRSFGFLFIMIVSALFFSCASTPKSYPRTVELDGEEMDVVPAIEMLAPELCTENPPKSRVDLFVSIYPAHLESLLSSAENDVPSLIQSFVEETNAASQRQAVRNRFISLPSGSFITEDERIQQLFLDSEAALENLDSLCRVQSALAPVPESITVLDDGKNKKTYEIKKLDTDFEAAYKKSKKALSTLYYDVAEIQFSGKTPEARIKLFELFDKAMFYDDEEPGLAKNVRMSRLATDIGDDFLAKGTFEDREIGLGWYKRSLSIYEDYPKTSQKVAAICFELGRDMLKASIVEEDYSRMSELLEKAAKYLEEAGTYKGASELLDQANGFKRTNREREESGN